MAYSSVRPSKGRVIPVLVYLRIEASQGKDPNKPVLHPGVFWAYCFLKVKNWRVE